MAEIIDCGELTPGKVFLDGETLYSVVDIAHNKTAMAKMKHKIKAKNLRTGAIVELMKFGGDRVQVAFLDKVEMQFLYADDDFAYFMNNENYEQIQLPKERVNWELQFLAPEANVNITYYGKEILGIQLPPKVTLTVSETDDNAVPGDTVNRATKDAVLETGYKIRVPMFVKTGQKIIVRTDTGEYDSRA